MNRAVLIWPPAVQPSRSCTGEISGNRSAIPPSRSFPDLAVSTRENSTALASAPLGAPAKSQFPAQGYRRSASQSCCWMIFRMAGSSLFHVVLRRSWSGIFACLPKNARKFSALKASPLGAPLRWVAVMALNFRAGLYGSNGEGRRHFGLKSCLPDLSLFHFSIKTRTIPGSADVSPARKRPR